MDPLSDILTLLKPKSYITAGFDAGGEWAVRFAGQSGRIKCYAITKGQCWLSVDGVPDPTRLHTGDCFVLPGGRGFTLASDIDVDTFPPATCLLAPITAAASCIKVEAMFSSLAVASTSMPAKLGRC